MMIIITKTKTKIVIIIIIITIIIITIIIIKIIIITITIIIIIIIIIILIIIIMMMMMMVMMMMMMMMMMIILLLLIIIIITHTHIHTCCYFRCSGTGKRYSNRKETSCVPLLNAGFEPGVPDTKSPADWMLADKPTELSRIKLKIELDSPSLWWASIQPTWPHCQLTFAPGCCISSALAMEILQFCIKPSICYQFIFAIFCTIHQHYR